MRATVSPDIADMPRPGAAGAFACDAIERAVNPDSGDLTSRMKRIGEAGPGHIRRPAVIRSFSVFGKAALWCAIVALARDARAAHFPKGMA
ncbi:hypothetical protein SAMN05216252_1357 [Actinacidiphila glaucinigra]|uniref:Uncharacterized protein n=1 Tax=Actinacidiphila glaucinigra TaxID=235986 RepID=A0A239NE24_9ACTN|nr:hypothetical protein SAMN05216252_1357 [Actinacidiphila glaucinigra]